MGSKSSKAQHLTSTKPGVTIKLPQEIIDEILDHLTADSDLRFLRSCALVSKSWVESCRRHLFYTILFTSKDMAKWLKAFPVPQQSPARHVRDLRFSLGGYYGAPEEFFRCTPWFTNVKKMTLLGHGGFRPLLMPLSVRLPQSVTSLTINTDTIALTQIRDVMAQLPNLDDLSLSGSVVVDRGTLPWMGAILRGRFGGQLRLLKGHANPDVVNMLLEVPTGLHFTEVEVRGTYECLLSTVRLAESCAKTLVKLSYAVSFHGKSHPPPPPSWFSYAKMFDADVLPWVQMVVRLLNGPSTVLYSQISKK